MLRKFLREAREAATQPRDFFARTASSEGWATPVARVALWFEAAALVEIILNMALGLHGQGDLALDLLVLVLFPVFGLAGTALAALVLHGLWRLAGGRAALAASWRAAAEVSFVMPLITLAQPLGVFSFAVWLWFYALLALAGQGVHKLPAARAWAVSLVPAALHLAALLKS